jgi:hypothetical protein
VLAGLLAFVLYAVTGSRGVEWQDPGVHQYRILTGQLEHPLGLALSHPLHYWLGRAVLHIPGGDAVHKLNLLSGLCGAVGVGVLAALVLQLTRSRPAGALAAAALAVSNVYWQMSALTETYTLAAALMTVEWVLLLRFVRTRSPAWLVAVFAVNGLHVADHLLGLLTLATYGVLLLERVARRKVAGHWLPAALAAWFVTASPYWTLVLSHYQHTGNLVETLRSAFFGGGAGEPGYVHQVLNTRLSLDQAKFVVLTFGYCFPGLTALLALGGIFRRVRSRRRLFRRVLLAQTVLICLFVARYSIRDFYTYLVPVCVLTALWFGIGVGCWLHRRRSRANRRWVVGLLAANLLLPPIVYFAFPLLARDRGWLRGQMRSIPFRDSYLHFFRPWRFRDDSPQRFANAALAEARPDDWLLADSTTAFPIAIKCLTGTGPPGVRVYWTLGLCLVPPAGPPLTHESVLSQVRSGHALIAAPSTEVDQYATTPLEVEHGDLFWRFRVRPPGSGAPPVPP